mgnify:FL=1
MKLLISVRSVDEALVAILKPLGEEKYFCAGYHPSVDLAFVKEQMPGLASRLRDTFVDVGTMRHLIRDFAQRPDLLPEPEVYGLSGRAMSDVQDALSEVRTYSQYLTLIPGWA